MTSLTPEFAKPKTPTLYIIRGLPGSGKSTLAKRIVNSYPWPDQVVHAEADMYHTDSEGNYNWRPENVNAAHEHCKHMVKTAMSEKKDVVVSNTFTRHWEYSPYIEMAKEHGYFYTVITCEGDSRWQNVHNVPEETLKKMDQRWEP